MISLDITRLEETQNELNRSDMTCNLSVFCSCLIFCESSLCTLWPINIRKTQRIPAMFAIFINPSYAVMISLPNLTAVMDDTQHNIYFLQALEAFLSVRQWHTWLGSLTQNPATKVIRERGIPLNNDKAWGDASCNYWRSSVACVLFAEEIYLAYITREHAWRY